jgi:hypothetical protein
MSCRDVGLGKRKAFVFSLYALYSFCPNEQQDER